MRLIILFALAATLLAPAGTSAQDRTAGAGPSFALTVSAELRDKALDDPAAYAILESLTSEIGPRPAGSPAAMRARDWGLARLKALGFVNVHAEPFAKPYWERGAESAQIIAPYPFKLSILGLGGTVPTPAVGIEGEIVVFTSLPALTAAPPGSLSGKIVVLNQPMTRTQDGAGYGAAVMSRYAVSAVAKTGAVAYLLRSVSTSQSREPHTGATNYEADAPKIPVAALGVPDANLLERLAGRGKVRLRLSLSSTVHPDTLAWNLVGDIPGSATPGEIIVIGGHLDSWDPGTGAIDDGAGIAITTAAANLIAHLPRLPRRTIRVVMWGSEETGGASEAYLAAHKSEVGKIVLAGESDLGADDIYSLQLPKAALNAPLAATAATVLAPLRIMVSSKAATEAGSDIEGIQGAGVPVFSFNQDAGRYFDLHHSADDTLEAVDPVKLKQNVAAWAAFLYLVADSDMQFRDLPAEAK
jgi:Zn-dependent M28 family amino/carboxypeptidase